MFAGKQHPEIVGVLRPHDCNLHSADCDSVLHAKLENHFDTLEQLLQRDTTDFAHSLKIAAKSRPEVHKKMISKRRSRSRLKSDMVLKLIFKCTLKVFLLFHTRPLQMLTWRQ